jgi:cytoskeletal protein RodZ
VNPERTIGETIRDARKAKGITQEGMSQGTRISLSVIRKLENDRFEELPGGLYTRNFIRLIAEFLEIDGQALLDRYGAQEQAGGGAMRRDRGASRKVSRTVQASDKVDVWREESVRITRFKAPRRLWRLWLGLLLVLVIGATALMLSEGWLHLDLGRRGTTASDDSTQSAGEVDEASALAGDLGATLPPAAADAESAIPPIRSAAAPPVFPGPLPIDRVAGEHWSPPTAPLRLEIRALGECRLSLNVDGKRHIGRRFPGHGGRWVIHGEEFFLLSATEGEHLRLRLNGEDYSLPGMGREPLIALRIEPALLPTDL